MTVTSETSCAKCQGPVDLDDIYVIGYSKQSAMEWVYLCGGCEAGLREWLATGPTEPVPDASVERRQ